MIHVIEDPLELGGVGGDLLLRQLQPSQVGHLADVVSADVAHAANLTGRLRQEALQVGRQGSGGHLKEAGAVLGGGERGV